jgi:hypothetical protein
LIVFTPSTCFDIDSRIIYPLNIRENLMSSSEIAAPASSAPTDRLALGVGWVRPGVAGIGGTLNPSGTPIVWFQGMCFEGSEE